MNPCRPLALSMAIAFCCGASPSPQANDNSAFPFVQSGETTELPTIDDLPAKDAVIGRALIADSDSNASQRPDDALRAIERKVALDSHQKALDEYARILTKLAESKLHIAIGPIDDGLTDEQIADWRTRQERAIALLSKASRRLRNHIEHLASCPSSGTRQTAAVTKKVAASDRMTKVFSLTHSKTNAENAIPASRQQIGEVLRRPLYRDQIQGDNLPDLVFGPVRLKSSETEIRRLLLEPEYVDGPVRTSATGF